MYFLYLLNVVVLLSFSNIVSSSPVAQGTTSHCNARDIAIVKRTANEPTYFCTWWNSDTRTRTPFIELTVSQVNNACKCISKSSKNKRAATIDHSVLSKGQSVESCSVEMSKQFTEPWHFCKFYTAYPRTTSPFRKYSAKSLLALCDCVEGKSISLTTKKSSTKKTSTTKTTIKASSTKSSSSKKPTSSSSKKVSSSSKKTSLSSSSSKRLASSSSRKATLSSVKSTKTSSTTKPISTSKSSTSSLRKKSSSSSAKKVSSSTKATSSSSSTSRVSTASRSSISNSLTFTSIKSSSSTKPSSRILSSSKPSVRTTPSSKSSSKLLSSSKSSTTKASDLSKSSSATTSKSASSSSSSVSSTSSSTTKSSSSTSSATATRTPTIRTDGQFYLRVENSAALPNDYYITTDDGYSLGPADPVLFAIGSNGFLYEVAGSDKYWIGTTFDSVGRGYIGGYSELGQYHTTNLRCAYDGDYLLSCATASVNGTLFPVTFSYLGLGSGYYEWFSNSKPNDLPTMDLYVELVAPSTSFSTSSSSSTISSTTSFTTSTIATSTALSNATSSYIAPTSSFNTSSIASPTAFSNATSSHIAPSNTTTSLYIASTSSLNTSSIASPTAFSNTTSSHIAPTNTTSSYIAPSNVTSSLAISSTVSSLASSTASSNTSSYASANASVTALPTVAPTCTLIPRVANGGFEDGKNQTAWSTIGGSYGSWAPTTTNPYDGALSGQFTFQISDGGSVQASTSSVTLRTTLSNLCPGFQYSISYNSFCAALSPERCFIALWTTETTEWGESFSSSRTGSGWLTGSNYLEFAAASSTSTLYVYVGTMAHNNGVGTIYLDDVSIALSESKDIVQEKVIV